MFYSHRAVSLSAAQTAFRSFAAIAVEDRFFCASLYAYALSGAYLKSL